MRKAHDVATIRVAERALMRTVPPGALMQRAAAGLAAVCAGMAGRVYGARIAVLAGRGDNGGDALYAGARLARRGGQVVAVAAGGHVHEQGAAALRAAGGRVTGPDDPDLPAVIAAADLVLDGLLGIGGRGGLREPYAALAGLVARAGAEAGRPRAGPAVVAVDLPSGIDADTGAVDGPAVRADVTVTFGTWKPGLLIDPGADYAGVVELVDIGLGPYLPPPAVAGFQAADVAALLRQPPGDSDKYRRGVLGVLAGSERFTGAAALAVGGALRGGAGMVRLVSAGPAAAVVRQHWPEALITVTGNGAGAGQEVEAAGRVQAWVAGPGMGTDAAARDRLAAVLSTDLPVLVDADGLTLVAQEPELLARAAPTLLTPHAGELGRLTGADPAEVEARRLEHARAAAAELGATVLLKGSTTVIAPSGPGEQAPVLVNPTGTSWLATAGTGDVLSGLAGALLAQGLTVAEAAAAAAFLHGIAARRAAAGTGLPGTGLPGPGLPGPGLPGPGLPGPGLPGPGLPGPGLPGPGLPGPGLVGAGLVGPGDGSPIAAGDVIDALPAAIRGVRAWAD
jgi:ADP-dependent NAD(P)H-hydrate dehydratase / NAD(P)H-hydrate epimerase